MDIEKLSSKNFDNIAVDAIMKKNPKLTEIEAEQIYNDMCLGTYIFDDECSNPKGYSSVRYAIMNRINKM